MRGQAKIGSLRAKIPVVSRVHSLNESRAPQGRWLALTNLSRCPTHCHTPLFRVDSS
jgi:hypothetical protein